MLILLAQLESTPEAPPMTGPWVYTVGAVSLLSLILFAWKAWRGRNDSSDLADPPELRYLAALRSEGREYTTPSGTLIIGPPPADDDVDDDDVDDDDVDDDDVIEEDRPLPRAKPRLVAPVEGDEPELEDESWSSLSADKRAGMLEALGARIAARRRDVEMDAPAQSEGATVHCPECGAGIVLPVMGQQRIVCTKCGAGIALRVVQPSPPAPKSLSAGDANEDASGPTT